MAWTGINLIVHEIWESIIIYYSAKHRGETGLKCFCIISKYFHSKDCNDKTFIISALKILMSFSSTDKILNSWLVIRAAKQRGTKAEQMTAFSVINGLPFESINWVPMLASEQLWFTTQVHHILSIWMKGQRVMDYPWIQSWI